MIAVPQAFFKNPDIKVILKDGLNGVIEKVAYEDNPDNERYVSAHAITVVMSGELKLRNMSGDYCFVKPGQMVFLPVGLYMISDIITRASPLKAYVFFFDDDVAAEFLDTQQSNLAEGLEFQGYELFKADDKIMSFLENMINLYGQSTNHTVTRYKIIEFLHFITSGKAGARFIDCLDQSLNRSKVGIKTFMERNFDKPLKIEDYAHLTGRSISTFHRDFKRQFGTAPKSWLVHRRLEKSKQLLEESKEVNVRELSYNSGYDNVSHFIKIFKNHFGDSPKQYQIKHRQNTAI